MVNFLDKKIKLVIFDLDGTLIESTSLWHDVDKSFFHSRGREIPENYGKEIAHLGLQAAAVLTKNKYCPNETVENILQEWRDLSLEEYQYKIPLKKDAERLLKLLKDNNVIITLATANSEELYAPCLKRLGIEEYFSYILDVNSCKGGKESPEIYDRIAHKYYVARENVLVFEDMLQAQITAYNAGYNVVGIFDIHSVKDREENKKYSHLYIDEFKEVIDLIK